MGDPRFPARFAAAARPGTYLAITTPGEVGAGDPVVVEHVPAHGLTVGDLARAHHRVPDPAGRARDELLAAFADCPELSDRWRAWAIGQLTGGGA